MTNDSGRLMHLAANADCEIDRAPMRRITTDVTQITCVVCRKTIVREVLTGTEPNLTILPGDLFP